MRIKKNKIKPGRVRVGLSRHRGPASSGQSIIRIRIFVLHDCVFRKIAPSKKEKKKVSFIISPYYLAPLAAPCPSPNKKNPKYTPPVSS